MRSSLDPGTLVARTRWALVRRGRSAWTSITRLARPFAMTVGDGADAQGRGGVRRRGGNAFMSDIAGVDRRGRAAGRPHRRRWSSDRLPAPTVVNLVVAPHEFFELFDAPTAALARALPRAASRSCTEQPGTPWFRT